MPDELTTLRRLRPDVDALAPQVIDAALARTRQRIDAASADNSTPTGHRRGRRRSVAITTVATLAAVATIATVLGLTQVAHPESAAAVTLHDAARATSSTAASTEAFTRVTARERALGYVAADGEHYDQGYLADSTTITWVPRDRSGTWIREYWSEPARTFYGGAAARKAAADDYATEAHHDDPERQQATGGVFGNGELGGTRAGTITIADLPGLPRDPDALVRRIEAAPRSVGATDDEQVFDTLAGLLSSGLVPADLRASMYEALATLPSIVVTERQASLDGRTGTAMGLAGRSGTDRREVIVDRSTGEYLGERTLQTRRTGSIPAGAVIDSISVETEQVRQAPSD